MRNLTMPSLQSSGVHDEAKQTLGAIGRLEEVSFQLRPKDNLSVG